MVNGYAMLCLNCGEEVAEKKVRCEHCGGSLLVNKTTLHSSLATASAPASAGKIEQLPKRRSRLVPGLVLGFVGLLVFLFVVPHFLRVRLSPHVSSAAGTLRSINTAAVTYASTYNRGFPPTLAALGPPKNGSTEWSENAAGFIDDILASGSKSGYRFSYIAGPVDSSGKISTYTVHADPVAPFEHRKNHYFTDQTGVVRVENDREAYASSPPIR